jgi:nuclear transport factor 2 (NTF2) superfamily protein
MDRPPLPPFTLDTATQKVRMAEDGWNSKDPAKVALAYTADSRWRNRSEFISGREEIEAFLTRKWQRELDYRLVKELWTFAEHRIAVRFAYEWHDHAGQWFRSYGNENWEFDQHGLMRLRLASINDLSIGCAGQTTFLRSAHLAASAVPPAHPAPGPKGSRCSCIAAPIKPPAS